jgi:hypothetical protein
VRIPPNRHPSEFTSPAQWGPFEYVVMDPKMLEVASLEVSDQRPIAFHYNPLNQKDSYSFGGYLAMYVLIPLNTSATGSQQIAIQVFNRPGSTFQFSQLITPSVEGPAIVIPREIEPFLNFNDLDLLSNAPLYVTDAVIQPDSLKQSDKCFNCFSLDTTSMSKFADRFKLSSKTENDEYLYPGQFGVSITKSPFTYTLDFKDDPAWQIVPGKQSVVFVVGETCAKTEASTKDYTATVVGDTIVVKSEVELSADISSGIILYSGNTCIPAPWVDNSYSAKQSNESFFMFRSLGTGTPITCFQTRRFSQAAYEGIFAKLISPDQCMLFLLRDKIENLNIGYVKLYSEGFFTARASPDQVIYPIQSVELVFDSYILRTDPIPYNATYTLNALAIRQKNALSRLSSAQRASLR